MNKKRKKEWWEKRYGTKKGIKGYFNTYNKILNEITSRKEIITVFNFLKEKKIAYSFEHLILDGFCGNGRHLKELIKLGFKNVKAFDYSNEMLTIAKKNLKLKDNKNVFFKEDGRFLSFSNKSFNIYYILGNSAFGFFDDPKDDLKVAKEAFRVLKSDGVFIFDLVDYNYVIKQLTNHTINSWENGILTVRQRETFQHNGLLRTGHTEIRYYKNKIEVQKIGRWVYKNKQIVDLLKKVGFNHIYIKNKAFCYEKNSDKYGTMGVRNLYIAIK